MRDKLAEAQARDTQEPAPVRVRNIPDADSLEGQNLSKRSSDYMSNDRLRCDQHIGSLARAHGKLYEASAGPAHCKLVLCQFHQRKQA